MQEALPWIIALAVLAVAAVGMAFWVTRPKPLDGVPLPAQWPIGPRTVFTVDERRAYRQLRDAFPQHIVLAKLPLIRFCQPSDAQEMRYWFDLLGSIHVSFAVCTPQGRVLATLDLDGQRQASRRTQQIKQNVLAACRIRYLRCTIDHLPSVSELQSLLPPQPAAVAANDAAASSLPLAAAAASGAAARAFEPPAARGPAAAPPAPAVRVVTPPQRPAPAAPSPSSPKTVADVGARDSRPRRQRKALWQDSGLFQDSFFGIDNLRDAGPNSEAAEFLESAVRSRMASAGPNISADPAQGMLESELLKQQQTKPR